MIPKGVLWVNSSVPSRTTTHKWFAEFHTGHMSTEDNEHTDSPKFLLLIKAAKKCIK